MGKNIFISYSHNDKELVKDIVLKIEADGHSVWIDECKLGAAEPLNTRIHEKIIEKDYVIVFLSKNSVQSKWVCQEVYAALHQELINSKVKLIPCILEACDLPLAFSANKNFNRIFIDFSKDRERALEKLLSSLSTNHRRVFHDENIAILDIPFPDLDIYLTGEIYPNQWAINKSLKYIETVDAYILFGFYLMPKTLFKHFVLCELDEGPDMVGKLNASKYIVTGSGDIDKELEKRRIWFKIREGRDFCNNEFAIQGDNNIWL